MLSEILAAVPRGWQDGAAERVSALAAAGIPPEPRAWRLWLEAHHARHAGAATLAHHALDAAEQAAAEIEPTPAWLLECGGLRAKLLHEAGDIARAYEPLTQLLQGWLLLGDALERPEGPAGDFARAAMVGAAAMVAAVMPADALEQLARETGAPPFVLASSLWMTERMPEEAGEMIARAIRVEADVGSYADACRLADGVLATTGSWSLPGWDPVAFAIRLRIGLSGAPDRERRFEAAIEQADAGLALAAQLPDGLGASRRATRLRRRGAVVPRRSSQPAPAPATPSAPPSCATSSPGSKPPPRRARAATRD